VLVGRHAELAELVAALEGARAGHGRLYLLTGEPGIGKTRLSDELTMRARERGAPVFWGRCWEAGGAPSYWPWLEVLSALAETLTDEELAQVLGDGAGLVAALAPSLATRLAAPRADLGSDPEEARLRLFRAASALLRSAASRSGAVVVIEDLHAADASSLRLLHFIARELRSMHALVLSTLRDVEARLSTEVGEAIGRLSREGTTLSLPRLGEREAAGMVYERLGPIDPDVCLQLFQRTQGNPLFLEEMIQWFRGQGSVEVAPESLPAGVRDVIRERLALVPAQARVLLEVGAVAGDEVDPLLIAEAMATAPEVVASALAEAARVGVLAPHGRQRFRFGHALFREVLERTLPPDRRAELHGKIAASLERRVARGSAVPFAELAHHLLEGPPSGLARAVECAVRAADDAVAVVAFEDALSLLERFLAHVERAEGSLALKAQVLVALARVHIRRGAGNEGQRLCLEAAEIARELRAPELLAAAALVHGLEIRAAFVDSVLVKLLEDALAMLPEQDSPLKVQLTARLAGAVQPHPDLAYPIGLARSAIATARRIGDAETLLVALFTGMSAMMHIVHPRERLPLNLEIEQLAEARSDVQRLIQTQARLALDWMELGDLVAADARIDHLERLATEARAQRFLWRVPLFRSMRAMIHGRFDECEALLARARALGLAANDPQFERTYVFHREGLLRTWERHSDMLAYEPEVRRVRPALYSGPLWLNGGSAFVYARLEDAERTRMYMDLVPLGGGPIVQNPTVFGHLGETLAFVGEPAAAASVYEALLPAKDQHWTWGATMFVWEGPAERVLGLLAARLGRRGAAIEHFDGAIQRLEALDAKPHLARTRYEYGRALLELGERGDTGRAYALVEEARRCAAQLGMAGLVHLAERRLAQGPAEGNAGSPRAGAAPTEPSTGGLPFSLVLEGQYWSVTYAGSTFRVRDTLGMQYLARLFAEPDRGIHVLTLSQGKGGGEGEVIDVGDAGEVLDPAAKESYRRRLAELREELEEARSLGDDARAERAQEEMNLLARELSRAVGLGGRARRAGGASERARSAVQRRIRSALATIRASSPPLADLLERTVRTGTVCVFSPRSAGR
jgi:tetratricopeptide (TPR) repeat protein